MSKNPPKVDRKKLTVANAKIGARMILNEISTLSREAFAKALIDKEGRDLNKECGYPDYPDARYYRDLYAREGIATRIVDVYPDECWSVEPEIYETEEDRDTPFEKAVRTLSETSYLSPYHFLHRADKLSGIGHYGILLLGLDDDRRLDKPVRGLDSRGQRSRGRPPKENKLIYLQTFSEDLVQIRDYEKDSNSPRYGHALSYNIQVADPTAATFQGIPPSKLEDKVVHWTRVVHFADNRMSSPVFGVPRMEPVLNRILDARKILGSSGEMFWQGGFPGFAFETNPDVADTAELDEESVKEQLLAYVNHLQRHLAITGMSIKPLLPQIADPGPHMVQQYQAIAAKIGVPIRILLGSEAGHLASTQDIQTWLKRVRHRQRNYLDPWVIRPFFDRLIAIGVLPQVERYYVWWPDISASTDKERADVAMKLTQSLLQYVTSGAWKLYRPKKYFTFIMRHTDAEANAIIKAAGGEAKLLKDLEPLLKKTVGNTPETTGKNPTQRTGSMGQRNSQGRGPRQPQRGR